MKNQESVTQETERDTGYSISITGRHVMVTEAMKQYALDKLSKLERLSQRILDIHLIMDIQKLDHGVDIIVRFNHTKIKVSASSEDMYNSVDRAVEKLQAQIRKYKEKLKEHHAKGISVVEMNVNVIEAPNTEETINDKIEDLNQTELVQKYKPHAVVKKEVRPLKTLTQAEAVMKMELSQDTFLVYRSEEDRKLKVIYRRGDTNYGIIEPE